MTKLLLIIAIALAPFGLLWLFEQWLDREIERKKQDHS